MYDKHPYVSVSANREECHAGWDSIGDVLRKALNGHLRIVCVECYPGVFENDLRDQLIALLNPSMVVMTESLFLSQAELSERVDPLLTDDPVFGVMNGMEMKR